MCGSTKIFPPTTVQSRAQRDPARVSHFPKKAAQETDEGKLEVARVSFDSTQTQQRDANVCNFYAIYTDEQSASGKISINWS